MSIPPSLRGAWLRLRALVRRGRVEAELDEELRFHVERETDERVRRGVDRVDARRQALRDFGGVERYKEECREARGTRWLEDGVRDLAHAARAMRRTPGFTLVAVLTLALGIGATTSIFSLVNGIALRPLPYATPDALVVVHSTFQGADDSASGADFLDWRAMARSFDGLAAVRERVLNLTGDGREPLRVQAARVSANLFSLLRVRAVRGRVFADGEDRTSRRQPVAMLGERLWRSRYGADPAIVSRTIELDGEATVVIGIVPAIGAYPADADLWIPLVLTPDESNPDNRGAHWFDVIGRLSAQASLASAGAEMRAIAQRLAAQYPEHDAGYGIRLASLRDETVGRLERPLAVLAGAVALVLLIACANVANLLVVRSAGRRREMALRTALGAERGRLLRQLASESALLFGLGGALGIVVAFAGTRAAVQLASDALPRLTEVSLDRTALGFATAVTGLTALLFGLLPAVQAFRRVTTLAPSLRDGGGARGAPGRRRRIQTAIVLIEVTLSVVLLVAAGLLLRSFDRLMRVDPGFHPDGLLGMRLTLPEYRYPSRDAQRRFHAALLEQLRGIPTVASAASVLRTPLSDLSFDISFWVDGRPRPKPTEEPSTQVRIASPGYFATMGIPVRRGREFQAGDRSTAPRVVVINEAFARAFFPTEDPIGKRVWLGWSEEDGRRGGEVVGIVGNVRQFALDRAPVPELYVAFDQAPAGSMTAVLRTRVPPRTVARAAREAVRALDPELPVTDLEVLDDVVRQSLSGPRFYVTLLTGFGLTALALAALGLYGVLSYAVQQRTAEIGIRIALGAGDASIARLVIGGSMRLVGLGVVAGALVALAATRVMRSLLYETRGTDPLTFALVTVVLLAAGWLASWLPTRRAVRVDPMTALRVE